MLYMIYWFIVAIMSFFGANNSVKCADHMTIVGLIQPSWVQYDKTVLRGRRLIYYYINVPGTPFYTKPSDKSVLIKNTKPIPETEVLELTHILKRLSQSINLRFERVADRADSDFTINFICNKKTDMVGEAEGVGMHSDQYNMLINRCAADGSVADRGEHYWRSIYLHELGHILGMEHPFDDFDKDCIYTTKPWASNSATKFQTMMAYIIPKEYPDWYTSHDMRSLVKIWGRPPGYQSKQEN